MMSAASANVPSLSLFINELTPQCRPARHQEQGGAGQEGVGARGWHCRWLCVCVCVCEAGCERRHREKEKSGV